MDPPLLPQIDFLQVDGRSVGRTVGRSAMMITNTDRMEWSGAEWSGDRDVQQIAGSILFSSFFRVVLSSSQML